MSMDNTGFDSRILWSITIFYSGLMILLFFYTSTDLTFMFPSLPTLPSDNPSVWESLSWLFSLVTYPFQLFISTIGFFIAMHIYVLTVFAPLGIFITVLGGVVMIWVGIFFAKFLIEIARVISEAIPF